MLPDKMAARYFDDYEEGEQDCSGDDQHGESFATVDTSAIQQQLKTTEYDIETFINEMEGYPCLWNPSTRSHHDQNMRSTAWDELSKKFGKPGYFSR